MAFRVHELGSGLDCHVRVGSPEVCWETLELGAGSVAVYALPCGRVLCEACVLQMPEQDAPCAGVLPIREVQS